MKHDFDDNANVCKACGVERIKNTKKAFFMRGGRLVNEPGCDERNQKRVEERVETDAG